MIPCFFLNSIQIARDIGCMPLIPRTSKCHWTHRHYCCSAPDATWSIEATLLRLGAWKCNVGFREGIYIYVDLYVFIYTTYALYIHIYTTYAIDIYVYILVYMRLNSKQEASVLRCQIDVEHAKPNGSWNLLSHPFRSPNPRIWPNFGRDNPRLVDAFGHQRHIKMLHQHQIYKCIWILTN